MSQSPKRTVIWYMQKDHLPVFETTIQKANEIFKDIEIRFGWTDRHKAYLAFRAVILTLRDRLPAEAAAAFAAQLPMVLKGVFYDGWKPAGKPIKMNLLEFREQVQRGLHPPYGIEMMVTPSFTENPEEIIRGVLAVVQSHTDPNEMRKVRDLLPREIAEMMTAKIPAM